VPELPPLAEFLRSRRDRLSPDDVGLRGGRRRRTPGLRREEVATLAGVSVDYLIRLEQGRDTNPSPDVLAALAGALQLDSEETRHLLGLAALGATPHLEQFCPTTPELDAEVPDSVRFVVDRLDPWPAFVLGPVGDIVAANRAWRALTAPLGLAEGDNTLRYVFLRPVATEVLRDWAAVADREVAALRNVHRLLERDQRVGELIDELSAVPAFADRWHDHPVTQPRRAALPLQHPLVGALEITQETMILATEDQRLVCWVPADEETADRIQRAVIGDDVGAPAHLRIVGGA
jgi:transcriptional regulator with XRE-family HTH domain